MSIRKHIPNIFTSLNILSGSIAIVFAFEGLFHITAIFIGIAALCDFADGMFARLLKAYSDIGKELDSLADMLSFGFTPAVVLFKLLQQTEGSLSLVVADINILPFAAFLITIFSALRLAIFNTDSRQSEQFIGLPTPANALFFVAIPFALHYGAESSFWHPLFAYITQDPYTLLGLTIVFSYLLVAEVPLFSLKLKNFRWAENSIRYVFLGFSVILLIFFGWYALPLIIILYIILSLAQYTGRGNKNRLSDKN